MQRIWLIFAQSVTACLGLLFVLRLFYPHLLENQQDAIVINQVGPSVASKANTSSVGSYSAAANKAMPAVVNIFTSSKLIAPNPHEQFRDDPLFKHFFGEPPENEEDSQPDSSLGSGVIVSEQGLIFNQRSCGF